MSVSASRPVRVAAARDDTLPPLHNRDHEQREQERQQALQPPRKPDTEPQRCNHKADRCDQVPLHQPFQRPVPPPYDLRQEDQIRGRRTSSLTEAA